jgi:hypothetical protein
VPLLVSGVRAAGFMGSKSREVIYGGRIIGAKIRADGAREAVQKAVREADRAAAELCRSRWKPMGDRRGRHRAIIGFTE